MTGVLASLSFLIKEMVTQVYVLLIKLHIFVVYALCMHFICHNIKGFFLKEAFCLCERIRK